MPKKCLEYFKTPSNELFFSTVFFANLIDHKQCNFIQLKSDKSPSLQNDFGTAYYVSKTFLLASKYESHIM